MLVSNFGFFHYPLGFTIYVHAQKHNILQFRMFGFPCHFIKDLDDGLKEDFHKTYIIIMKEVSWTCV